jgi:hypothetical protein
LHLRSRRCVPGDFRRPVVLVIARETIGKFVVDTINVHDGEVEAGEELPPSNLLVRQVLLGLEVLEALMVGY